MGRSDLPIETVRRLCCDTSLVAVIEDERGAPCGMSRKQRTVSATLKRLLLARDRGCTFPGCHRKRFVDAHHIRHWADGGETSPENLTLLCTQHHRLLHEGSFAIKRDVAGVIYFQRRDGRVIPRGGYKLDDVVDDGAVDESGAAMALPGAMLERLLRRPKPSAEVREAPGVYRRRAQPKRRANDCIPRLQ